MKMSKELIKLMENINYKFKDISLLKDALISGVGIYLGDPKLKIIGENTLNFIIIKKLHSTQVFTEHRKFPLLTGNQFKYLHIELTKNNLLSKLARKIQLQNYTGVSEGCLEHDIYYDRLLANTMKTLIGSIYLDSNIETCEEKVLSIYGSVIKGIFEENRLREIKT